MYARFVNAAMIAAAVCALAAGEDKQLQFEVASVRPNKSGGLGARMMRPSPLRWEAENVPLMFLIQEAWDCRSFGSAVVQIGSVEIGSISKHQCLHPVRKNR